MYQNNISFLYFILIRLFAQKKRNYAVNNKMKNGSSGITQTKEISLWFVRLILSQKKLRVASKIVAFDSRINIIVFFDDYMTF